MFFFLVLGLRLQRYLTNTKDISRIKVFGNPEFDLSARTSMDKERLNDIYPSVTSHDLSSFGKTFPFSGN